MPADERQTLVAYLRAGRVHKSYLGYSWCRFGCGIEWTRMGSRDLTDGSWVWPQGLAHYVAEHQITLPEQFVGHALRSTPVHQGIGELTGPGEASSESFEVSDALWTQWASARRWPQVLEQLGEARRRTAAYHKAKWIERIEQLEREQGLSSEQCRWRDCRRSALAGTYVCAGHSSDISAASDADLRGAEEFHAILEGLTRAHGQIAEFRPLSADKSNRLIGGLRRLFQRILR
jgi:hypothetical protein